jgi:thiosulfate/3-mercaptopyruvate sulfurtransferase
VVIYDDSSGAIASRMWWLLRWIGHQAVAVLDGGFNKWQQEHRPLSTTVPDVHPVEFIARPRQSGFVSVDTVLSNLDSHEFLLLDARDEKRFRGEIEPLDPVAGHIPGARNAPFNQNLDNNGCFKDPATLAQYFRSMLGDRVAEKIIHSCGSGVTACHNLLAMEHAGLTGSLLYPGSWSEWVSDSSRPVATGED